MNRTRWTLIALTVALGLITLSLQRPALSEDKQKPEAKSQKLLRHMVLFKFKEDATEEQVKHIVEEFRALPKKIDEIHDFEWGPDSTVEPLTHGFTHAFVVTFKTQDDLKAYLPHEAHQAFVKELRPILDEVLVFDYFADE